MKVSTAPNKPGSKTTKPSPTGDDDDDDETPVTSKPTKPTKASQEVDLDAEETDPTDRVAVDSEENEQVSILAQKDLYPAPTIGKHSFPDSGIKEFKRGKTYTVPAWTLPYLRDAKVAV